MYQLRLRGRVVSGLGEGAKYVAMYRRVIKKFLGIDPYPGTLNVDLGFNVSGKLSMLPAILIPPPREGLGFVISYKGLINGLKVFVIKPVITRHEWNILEIISEHYLREKLGLRDNSLVEVTLYFGP